MAQLTKQAAQQQLANEVKWWRQNFKKTEAWKNRTGWSSRVGNKPSDADTISQTDYNALGNAWCKVNTNEHKKRSQRVDSASNHTVFKEADKSLSGGKGTCHFIESWSDGNKFNWHFKLA